MKPKILICDDEVGIRESLKLILEDNYEAILCDKPEECLTWIKNNPEVKLVLLDIKMPKMDGLITLRQIKSFHPDMKVIMVTGYRAVDTATEAINAGADDYIVKPFDSKDIQERVAKTLE
ncbi:MAG: response regulator [Candidatus Omnitrophota bacterium]|nr:response regulator [Candidatus Omnitrophota bacterium]